MLNGKRERERVKKEKEKDGGGNEVEEAWNFVT